ncbi:heat-shock protein Hsp20, partial [Mycobacterium sp. ITM-2017-0098]
VAERAKPRRIEISHSGTQTSIGPTTVDAG